MASFGSQYSETIPTALPNTCHSAMIPPGISKELLERPFQQPIFPPPAPQLFQNILKTTPIKFENLEFDATSPTLDEVRPHEQSPPSKYINTRKGKALPKLKTRNSRRRAAYLKARAHYARDRKLRQIYTKEETDGLKADQISETTRESPSAVPPTLKAHLRKRSAFVIDEDVRSQLEARADTPHISEAIPGEDVSAPELAIASEDVPPAERGLAMKRCVSLTSVTSVPGETVGMKKE
jgi:hypothetical protein